jgi:hypothetical protein
MKTGRRASAGGVGTAVGFDCGGGRGGGGGRIGVCASTAGRGSPVGIATGGPLGIPEPAGCVTGRGKGVATAVAVALLVAACEGSLSE